MPLDQEFEQENSIEEDGEGTEMSFIDHLEELRWHLIRAAASILVFGLVALVNIQWLYTNVIMAPGKVEFWTYRMLCKLSEFTGYEDLCVKELDFKVQNIEPGGQFMMAITSAIVAGLVFSFPYIFWEIWRFIKPGLKEAERKAATGAVFFVTTLFFSGVLFGYYVVTPLAMNFLVNFRLDPSISNEFNISAYISTILTLTLACGVAFQLPIIIFVLSKIGILTPKFMRTYRKHAYVVILIVAAVITPSPDILSQILVAFPLLILYEIGIGVSRRVEKARKASEIQLDRYNGQD